MLDIEQIKSLIEKSILACKAVIITYTKGTGETDQYIFDKITSVWNDRIRCISHSITKNKRPSSKEFRYDRISKIELSDEVTQPNEYLNEKIKDRTLFNEEDNRLKRKGGIIYPSSISYLSPYEIETKEEISKQFSKINIEPKKGWDRAIMYKIHDGDSFDIILEKDKSSFLKTRLYGVDTPEYNEDKEDDNSLEYNLGLEAKVFVEDLFKNNRFCYVKEINNQEKDAYKRALVEIMNEDNKNVGLELLQNGMGIPMIGYFTEKSVKDDYIAATKVGYNNRKGLWSIQDLYERYNNIINDDNRTEFNILKYIPNKISALGKYLDQNPSVTIYQKALNRRKEKKERLGSAEKDYQDIIKGLDIQHYNLDEFKELCKRYLDVCEKLQQEDNDIQRMFDYLEHIAEQLDELNLGEGNIKGNFSTASLQGRLIYHIEGGTHYGKTIPEIMFKSEEDAKYCGFRKSKQ